MRALQFIKLALGVARHPVVTARVLSKTGTNQNLRLTDNIRLAADWLVKAQAKAPDGAGYSRRYSLVSGWDRCYIETTGYIVPTMLDVSQCLQIPRYRESAIEAANWLLTVQLECGAFTDIDSYSPQVFDTGQVLLGLNRMFLETGDPCYQDALRRAAQWLVDMQEPDGSWVRYAYNNRPHAYYTRVAAALIQAGHVTENDEFVSAGARNLEWARQQRESNGYYQYSEFRPGEDAILHTIVYVFEGFSMAYELTHEQVWADALVEGVELLGRLANHEGLLYSQYDSDWQVTNKEFCVTGLAQYVGVCLDVLRITGNPEYQEKADHVLAKLCVWQQQEGSNLKGALQSSVPLWGYYGGMEFYNWNVKFFLDSALKRLKSGGSLNHDGP